MELAHLTVISQTSICTNCNAKEWRAEMHQIGYFILPTGALPEKQRNVHVNRDIPSLLPGQSLYQCIWGPTADGKAAMRILNYEKMAGRYRYCHAGIPYNYNGVISLMTATKRVVVPQVYIKHKNTDVPARPCFSLYPAGITWYDGKNDCR